MPDGAVSIAATFKQKKTETTEPTTPTTPDTTEPDTTEPDTTTHDCPSKIFTDVDLTQYYHEGLDWAVTNKVTTGTTDTTFEPDKACTRAQAVTFLWRAAGSPEPTKTTTPFTDADANEYYYKAMLWATEQGIIKGTSATTFSPNAACTRGQIATMLYREAGSPKVSGNSGFTDVAADAYYADAVVWAVNKGITLGTSDTTFSPENDCTRAQIVTMLYRAAN